MNLMITYTVYDHPEDYPDHYVVRRFFIEAGNPNPIPEEDIFMQSGDLQEIRETLLGKDLVCVGRVKEDDSKIVETWI